MIGKRFFLALAALLSLVATTQSMAQGISQKVAVCDPAWVNRCIKPDTSGNVPVTVTSSTGTLATQIQGNSASGAADVGNPVMGAGQYNGTLPIFADGNRGDLQIGIRGGLHVELYLPDSAASISGTNWGADNQPAGATNGLYVQSRGYLFDGTDADRMRSIPGSDGTGLGIQAIAAASCSAATCGQVPTVFSNVSAPAAVKASAGNLYAVTITLLAGQGPGFVQVTNTTTLPADGAVTPLVCRYVPAGPGSWSFDLTTATIPKRFGTGISAYLSSGANCRTKTAATFEQMEVSFQ
jgi:hypothetical protein